MSDVVLQMGSGSFSISLYTLEPQKLPLIHQTRQETNKLHLFILQSYVQRHLASCCISLVVITRPYTLLEMLFIFT